MAYSTFEKYDFYTKPETEDYSFTKHMIAQSAADNNAVKAQREKDKQVKKDKNLTFSATAPYENDNNNVNGLVSEIKNSLYENSGELTPEAQRKMNEATIIDQNSKIQEEQAKSLVSDATLRNAENIHFDKNLALQDVQAAQNGEGIDYKNRGGKLTELQNSFNSYKYINAPSVYSAFTEKRKDGNNKFDKTNENANTGFTNKFERTTKAPFRSEVYDNNGKLIGHEAKVTQDDVQAFIAEGGEGGGVAVYNQELEKIKNDPKSQEMLSGQADALMSSLGTSDKAIKEVIMANLLKKEAENAIYNRLNLMNNALASVDQATTSTYQPRPERLQKAKIKGDKEKDAPVVAFNSNKSQRVVKASWLNPNDSPVKDEKGNVKTKDVFQRRDFNTEINYVGKPIGFEIQNTGLLNLSESKGDRRNKEGKSVFYPVEVERAWAMKGGLYYGQNDTGERIDNVVGYIYDVVNMDDKTYVEYKRKRQGSEEDNDEGKLKEFAKYRIPTSTVLTPTLAKLMKERNIDLTDYFEEKNKRGQSKPKENNGDTESINVNGVQLSKPKETKISRSVLSAKAKASGYTEKDYEALLIKNGVKIE